HTRWPRDWSSDVCSSDLIRDLARAVHLQRQVEGTALHLIEKARQSAKVGLAVRQRRVPRELDEFVEVRAVTADELTRPRQADQQIGRASGRGGGGRRGGG